LLLLPTSKGDARSLHRAEAIDYIESAAIDDELF